MSHSFLSHLVAILSVYELGPGPTPLPRYDGPRDWQMDAIERSLASVARRMYTAEDQLCRRRAITPNSLADLPRTLNGDSHADSDPEVTPVCYNAAKEKASPISEPSSRSTVPASAPATTHQSSEYFCPTCGCSAGRLTNPDTTFSPTGSPVVVPPGPLIAAAFESGMSTVEELRLLKAQVPDIARAVALGDLSQKVTVLVQSAMMIQMKDVINTMVDKLRQFAEEVTRVSQEELSYSGDRALLLDGTWRELTNVVSFLVENHTNQVRSIAPVTKAVTLGDLSKQIEWDANGEILDLKTIVNGMVFQLRMFATEVARITLEFRSQGKLGDTAEVPLVEDVWRELIYSVNQMCSNLTKDSKVGDGVRETFSAGVKSS